MAKGGVIGNLRVNMGLDSAQFQAGVAKVSKSMDAVAKKAAVFGAAVGTAMAGLATAMSVAVKRSINEADNMAKAAQKFGVGVEELSRLKHAADLSGVSLETLGTSMRKLSQNMQETANGAKNTASQAFAALGVAVKNADGSLRSSTEVMGDVAERFARMDDGAQKTALAMAIFGRAGTDLIPMLNAGRDGLHEMMQEADRLGIVLDTNTAKAAENFNDNMTRLGRVWDGLVMKLSAHLLPALEMLSEKMMDFVNNESAVQAAAQGIGKGFLWIARQAAHLVLLIDRIKVEFVGLKESISLALTGDFSGAKEAWFAGQNASAKMRDELDAFLRQMETGFAHSQGAIQRRIDGAFGTVKDSVVGLSSELADAALKIFDATRTPLENYQAKIEQLGVLLKAGAIDQDTYARAVNMAKEALDRASGSASKAKKALTDPALAEAARIFEATRTPLEQYQAQIARLNELLAAGAISQDTYNRAVAQAQDAFAKAEEAGNKAQNTFQQIGQSIGQTLSSSFQGLIDGSKKVKDVLKDLLSQLASMLMNRAFQMLFSGSGGGFGGLFSGIGKLFGFRANGGPVSAGRPYVVGERGPELMVPNVNGTVVRNADLVAGRSAGNITVEQHFHIDGAISSRDVQQMVRAGASEAVDTVKRSLTGWQHQIARDGAVP